MRERNAPWQILSPPLGVTAGANPLLLSAYPGKDRDQNHGCNHGGDNVHGIEIGKVLDDVSEEEVDQSPQERADQPYDQSSPELSQQGLAQNEGVEHRRGKTDGEVCQPDVEVIKQHIALLLPAEIDIF